MLPNTNRSLQREFDGIERDNAKDLQSQVRECFRRGDYLEACRLIDAHPEVDVGWLRSAAEDRANLERDIEKYLTKARARERLEALGVLQKGQNFSSTQLRNGLVSVGAVIHEVNGRKIFEKIFASKARFSAELLVSSTLGGGELGVPAYIGHCSDKDLHSLYSEAVDVIQCDDDVRKAEARLNFAVLFWRNEIELPGMNEHCTSPKFDMELKDTDLHQKIEHLFCSENPKSYFRLEKFVERSINSPKRFFHDDLYDSNVLYDGKKFFIIDWEKFCLIKVGAGLHLKRKYFVKLGVEDLMLKEIESRELAKLSLVNFCLYNIFYWYKRGRPRDCLFYAERLKNISV